MLEDGGKGTVGRARGVIRVRRKSPDRLGDDSTVVLGWRIAYMAV